MKALQAGFSLIEMLVTILIIAILFAITLPAYQRHIETTERRTAEMTLMMAANRMEDYFQEHHTYENATLALLNLGNKTQDGAYGLSIDKADAATYLISATPHFNDRDCGTLMLDEKGEETDEFQAPNCW